MAITKVQQATGNGATIALTSVASGNALILCDTYYRSPSTGAGEAVPTDTQGTWSIASNGTPGLLGSFYDCGSGIFYQNNVASGTHTVTPQSNDAHNATLSEWSGLSTTSFDVSANARTNDSSFTSQVTGTTATTAQADEVVIITLCLLANGVTDVGFTDPVSGFTTLQKVSNDASDVATFHAYKIVAATGTQAATFNWTDNEPNQAAGANIATFKAVAAGGDTLMGMACL